MVHIPVLPCEQQFQQLTDPEGVSLVQWQLGFVVAVVLLAALKVELHVGVPEVSLE